MINRDKALQLLDNNIHNQNLIKHMIATEAIMRSLAEKLDKDQELWRLTGLLHDLDFEQTKNSPEKHSLVTEQILREEGIVNQKLLQAIKSHNAEMTGQERKSDLDYALTAAEQISGLIVGCALVMPDKKLDSVTPETILKKFKQKSFTTNVNRELIRLCQKLGFSLEDFADLSLKAMQQISTDLGL